MASAKSRRYGQGGMKHIRKLNLDRPNGKAWKKLPKGFTVFGRRLVTVPRKGEAGTTGLY